MIKRQTGWMSAGLVALVVTTGCCFSRPDALRYLSKPEATVEVLKVTLNVDGTFSINDDPAKIKWEDLDSTIAERFPKLKVIKVVYISVWTEKATLRALYVYLGKK